MARKYIEGHWRTTCNGTKTSRVWVIGHYRDTDYIDYEDKNVTCQEERTISLNQEVFIKNNELQYLGHISDIIGNSEEGVHIGNKIVQGDQIYIFNEMIYYDRLKKVDMRQYRQDIISKKL